MNNDMFQQCRSCCARDICPAEAMPGSIMCMMKRMQSGQTHGDEVRRQRRCPYCGRIID